MKKSNTRELYADAFISMKASIKRTPRKQSCDSSYKKTTGELVEKLRSNSSFKKKSRQDEESVASPSIFRGASRSRTPSKIKKSLTRLKKAGSKQDFDFIPLMRKCTKNSDVVYTQQQKEENRHHYSKACDSKETLSLCKSLSKSTNFGGETQTESWIPTKKVSAETKLFYHEIEKLMLKKSKSSNGRDWRKELPTLKKVIYNELDELFVSMEDIEISKKIGKGATAEVFIGQFRFCSVAVKKIKMTTLSCKQVMNLINELDCLRRLRHPNIISVFGISVDSNQTVYIVTELCEQLSLKSFFKKFEGKIPPKVKLKMLMDIATALYHIHRENPAIIHRDLKPENIFLTGDLKAKLGDFG